MIPAWLLIPAALIGATAGLALACILASRRVTEAQCEAEVWRRDCVMWRDRALGLGTEALK